MTRGWRCVPLLVVGLVLLLARESDAAGECPAGFTCILGAAGESCNTTCAAAGKTCDMGTLTGGNESTHPGCPAGSKQERKRTESNSCANATCTTSSSLYTNYCICTGGSTTPPPPPPPTLPSSGKILFFHGMGMHYYNTFPGLQLPGWFNINPIYEGSARVGNSTVAAKVKAEIINYCTGTQNCIIACYSAGCNRVFNAFYQLAYEGRTLPGLQFVMATASSMGGSEVADYLVPAGLPKETWLKLAFGLALTIWNPLAYISSLSFVPQYLQWAVSVPTWMQYGGKVAGLLSNAFSDETFINHAIRIAGSACNADPPSILGDLTTNHCRNSSASIQNIAPKPVFHVGAGLKDSCKSACGFTGCGNDHLPGRIGDGAVAPHSACGYAQIPATPYRDCGVSAPRYTNRSHAGGAYGYPDADHAQTLAIGLSLLASRTNATYTPDTRGCRDTPNSCGYRAGAGCLCFWHDSNTTCADYNVCDDGGAPKCQCDEDPNYGCPNCGCYERDPYGYCLVCNVCSASACC